MSLQRGWKYFPFEDVNIKSSAFCTTFGSLKIIQLSDLHLTKDVDIGYLEELVKKINMLEPDIVVFTGDIIQVPAMMIKEHLHVFASLNAKSYYVTGNHDIVYGPKPLHKIMSSIGIESLDNKIVKLNIKGGVLQLVGLSDRYGFVRGIKRSVIELFSKLDETLPTILLAHQPKDIRHVKDSRIDIQLSGHTHGGQVYPFNIIVKYFQPHFSGLYTHNKTLLYVSRGLGYWGVNIRYKVPSEIPVFTIN